MDISTPETIQLHAFCGGFNYKSNMINAVIDMIFILKKSDKYRIYYFSESYGQPVSYCFRNAVIGLHKNVMYLSLSKR